MYYQRSEQPLPYGRRLAREELKVYTTCRSVASIETISSKTGLRQEQVIQILNQFVLEELVDVMDSNGVKLETKTPKAKEASKENTLTPDNEESATDGELASLRQKLVNSLHSYLSAKEAKLYYDELKTCKSKDELKETAHKMAIKIKLTLSKPASKALLDLLKQF